MNKWKLFILIFLFPCLSIGCGKKDGSVTASPKLRVLGYLFSNNWTVDGALVDFPKITDLNLAFINPDASGNFTANNGIRQLVQKAHENKVRVFLSFGGGDAPAYLADLIKAGQRAAFIQSLVDYAVSYEFDGIDVDLENSLINADYTPFVEALAIALKEKAKLLTAAVAGWNAGQISDVTLRQYDFINIMSYDKAGPWNLSNPRAAFTGIYG